MASAKSQYLPLMSDIMKVSNLKESNYKSLSDDKLVLAFQNGSHAAFEQLVKRYERKVISLALNYTGSKEDAKDIYQEAFIRVFRYIHKFEMRSKFSTWLYRIVVNLCLTHLSSSKKYISFSSVFHDDEDQDESLAIDRLMDVPDKTPSVDAKLLIQDALGTLNEKQRLFFVLKHIEGFKLKEISEITNSTIGVVKKTLFVALGKIREYVKKNS